MKAEDIKYLSGSSVFDLYFSYKLFSGQQGNAKGDAVQVAVEQHANLGARQNWLHSWPQPLT